MNKRKSNRETPNETVTEPMHESPLKSGAKPLIFISHDSRDADLAEVFENLLTDASGGMLKSFRSSDRKGVSGIEFGAEWYPTLMEKLNGATDVVALLTPHSIDRPWILYEAGVAKGKLGTIVLGLAIGVPLEKANTGPFAQFENLGDDEDSLTKLVLGLIQRNQPDATPREEAVRRQVSVFREQVGNLIKNRPKGVNTSAVQRVDETVIAKLFEEVKVMFRDLPGSIEQRIQPRRYRRIHPMMMEELLHHPALRATPDGEAMGWLMFISMIRDDFPGIYEIGMDLYEALKAGDQDRVASARKNFIRAVDVFSHGPWAEMWGGPEGRERDTYMLLRHMPEMMEHYFHRREQRKGGRLKAGDAATEKEA